MSSIDLIRLTNLSEKHMFYIFSKVKDYVWEHAGNENALINYPCQGVIIENNSIWLVENYDDSLGYEKKRGNEVKELGIKYIKDFIYIYKEV